VGGRCYTLDVNPTSGSRVKARLYETRPVSAGGNVLLMQGQLSVKQFQMLESLLLAGAAMEGTEFVRVGRYYSAPLSAESKPAAFGVLPACRPVVRGAGARLGAGRESQPHTPWLRGPVIGPNGVEDVEDYDTLAHRHVERMLRRQRASA